MAWFFFFFLRRGRLEAPTARARGGGGGGEGEGEIQELCPCPFLPEASQVSQQPVFSRPWSIISSASWVLRLTIMPGWLLLWIFKNYFIWVGVLPMCLSAYHVYAWYPKRPGKGTGPLRTWITKGCELPRRSWGSDIYVSLWTTL